MPLELCEVELSDEWLDGLSMKVVYHQLRAGVAARSSFQPRKSYTWRQIEIPGQVWLLLNWNKTLQPFTDEFDLKM